MWQKHTQYVYQRVRVRVRLRCLYRLCPLPNELLGKLYCTFILPILDYCDVVWSPSSVQYFKRFERIHSKFCSLVPATQSFLCHTLAERRRFHTAIIVYKILHQLSPAYLRATFNYTTTVTSHVGRNSHRLFVPRVRTIYAKNSLYYKGTQIWNLLNASLYAAATLGQFKHLNKYYCMYVNVLLVNACSYIANHCVFRALLKSSSFLLTAVFPSTIKKLRSLST